MIGLSGNNPQFFILCISFLLSLFVMSTPEEILRAAVSINDEEFYSQSELSEQDAEELFALVADMALPDDAQPEHKDEFARELHGTTGNKFSLGEIEGNTQVLKQMNSGPAFNSVSLSGRWADFKNYIENEIFQFILNLGAKPMSAFLGRILNHFSWVRDFITRTLMATGLLVQQENYSTDPAFDGHDKNKYPTNWYIRTLPPRKDNVDYLQTPKEVVDNIFSRPEGSKGTPESNNNSCLFFPWFAQWFVEEFFKTGKSYTPDIEEKNDECSQTWGGNQIDLSTLYGSADFPERTRALRLLKHGKMKTSTINGEAYPPFWKDLSAQEQDACPMLFPDSVSEEKREKFFALGHPRHNLHPGLMVMYTIFLREHNRVCDGLLKQESTKNCTDDQLFEIARKVLIGILLKLVVNAYIQHINPAKSFFLFQYKPELLKKIPDWSSNPQTHRIAQEFDLLYRWHPLIPDTVDDIDGTSTPVPDTFWDTNYLTSRGIDAVVRSAIRQPANAFGYKKSPRFLASLDASGVRQAREKMKLQSFTAYAKRFGSSGPKSFEDFNPEAVDALKAAYESVDDIEFFVGIINEKVTKGIFPSTLTTLVLAHAMNGIFANELSIHGKWTESTFGGGKFAFDVANNVTLPDLIARNTNLEQKEVSFNVIA